MAGVREDAPVGGDGVPAGLRVTGRRDRARWTVPAAEAATVTVRAGSVPSLTVTRSPAANPLPLTVIAPPAATVPDGRQRDRRLRRATRHGHGERPVLLDSVSHAVTCTV